SFLRGRTPHFGRRTIAMALFHKAVTLVVLFFAVLFVGFILLVFTEDQPGLHILFEAVSALTVTGYSLGITEDLTSAGKMIVIGMMMIGRVGFITFVYLLIS